MAPQLFRPESDSFDRSAKRRTDFARDVGHCSDPPFRHCYDRGARVGISSGVSRRGPTGRLYLDLTADLAPYGEVPLNDQGQFALVVHPNGTSEQVVLPEADPAANLLETRITGTLTPNGYVTASYEERGRGSRQYSLRQLFLGPIDSTHRADFARAVAAKLHPGAEANSLQIFDGRDLTADTRFPLSGPRAPMTGANGAMKDAVFLMKKANALQPGSVRRATNSARRMTGSDRYTMSIVRDITDSVPRITDGVALMNDPTPRMMSPNRHMTDAMRSVTGPVRAVMRPRLSMKRATRPP